MKTREINLRSVVVSIIVLLLFSFSSAGNHNATVRIMPLGDSITWDITFGDTRPDGLRTGYRQPLWLLLQNDGFDINFVGSLVAGQDAIPAFDPDNEGHSGWTDSQIAANIYNWLTLNPADVILLHIGTNGLDPSPNDISTILDEVNRYETDHAMTITVFVARIIQRVPYSGTTTQFNDNVEAMVTQRRVVNGDQVYTVDMEDGAGLVYVIDTQGVNGDMYDYLHPNSVGYTKMANQWYAHLRPFLLNNDCAEGIAHYWKMDENVAGTAVDDIAGLDATCSSCPASIAGRVRSARQFSGGASLSIPDHNDFDWTATDPFAIELWLHLAQYPQSMMGVLGRNTTSGEWKLIVTPTGNLNFDLQSSTQSLHLTTVPMLLNGWHHIAVSRDSGNGSTYMFLDGSPCDTGTVSFAGGFAGTDPVFAGDRSGDGLLPLNGAIDELAFYRSALSPATVHEHYLDGTFGLSYCEGPATPAVITSTPSTQVLVGNPYEYVVNATGRPHPVIELMTSPQGMTLDTATERISWSPTIAGAYPVSIRAFNAVGSDTQDFMIMVTTPPVCPDHANHYWPLDEVAGMSSPDLIGDNPASCSSCPTTIAGIIEEAQKFNPSAGNMSIADDGTIDWSAGQSFSISFWMRRSGTPTVNEVIVGRAGASWWLGVYAANPQVAGVTLYGLLCYFGGQYVYSNAPVNNGQWHHIVCTRDGMTGTMQLYVDGHVNSTGTVNQAYVGSDVLTLGWFAPSPYYRFGGDLDELCLHNRVLTTVEIADLHQQGLNSLSICYTVMCGDADGSGLTTISDAVYLVNYIFGGGPAPNPLASGDADCTGMISISDAVYLISYIFAGGAQPCAACQK